MDNGDLIASVKAEGAGEPSYSEMRTLLEQKCPDSLVLSPLECAGIDSIAIGIYKSTDRHGVGRSGSSFYQWAICGAEKGKA
jgi:hypothetical protein